MEWSNTDISRGGEKGMGVSGMVDDWMCREREIVYIAFVQNGNNTGTVQYILFSGD